MVSTQVFGVESGFGLRRESSTNLTALLRERAGKWLPSTGNPKPQWSRDDHAKPL